MLVGAPRKLGGECGSDDFGVGLPGRRCRCKKSSCDFWAEVRRDNGELDAIDGSIMSEQHVGDFMTDDRLTLLGARFAVVDDPIDRGFLQPQA